MPMTDPISSIRNLGPAYEASCARAGIHTAQQLRALGADTAYGKLLQTGMKPHFIGYYVLAMGLQGRPWNDCKGDEKKALRLRFDAIKAQSFDQGRSDFEAALNAIGVIERRSSKG
jgi:TfoX C-terminal domain